MAARDLIPAVSQLWLAQHLPRYCPLLFDDMRDIPLDWGLTMPDEVMAIQRRMMYGFYVWEHTRIKHIVRAAQQRLARGSLCAPEWRVLLRALIENHGNNMTQAAYDLANAMHGRLGAAIIDHAMQADLGYNSAASGGLWRFVRHWMRRLPVEMLQQWIIEKGSAIVLGHGFDAFRELVDIVLSKAGNVSALRVLENPHDAIQRFALRLAMAYRAQSPSSAMEHIADVGLADKSLVARLVLSVIYDPQVPDPFLWAEVLLRMLEGDARGVAFDVRKRFETICDRQWHIDGDDRAMCLGVYLSLDRGGGQAVALAGAAHPLMWSDVRDLIAARPSPIVSQRIAEAITSDTTSQSMLTIMGYRPLDIHRNSKTLIAFSHSLSSAVLRDMLQESIDRWQALCQGIFWAYGVIDTHLMSAIGDRLYRYSTKPQEQVAIVREVLNDPKILKACADKIIERFWSPSEINTMYSICN